MKTETGSINDGAYNRCGVYGTDDIKVVGKDRPHVYLESAPYQNASLQKNGENQPKVPSFAQKQDPTLGTGLGGDMWGDRLAALKAANAAESEEEFTDFVLGRRELPYTTIDHDIQDKSFFEKSLQQVLHGPTSAFYPSRHCQSTRTTNYRRISHPPNLSSGKSGSPSDRWLGNLLKIWKDNAVTANRKQKASGGFYTRKSVVEGGHSVPFWQRTDANGHLPYNEVGGGGERTYTLLAIGMQTHRTYGVGVCVDLFRTFHPFVPRDGGHSVPFWCRTSPTDPSPTAP